MASTKRRVTKSRSWAQEYGDNLTHGVVFERGWVDGAYVVKLHGATVAQCTDKWMSEMVFKAATGVAK